MGDDGTTPAHRTPRARLLLPPLLLLAIVLAVTLALTRGSGGPALPGGVREAPAASGFFGTLALPARQAPPIGLRDYLGRPVTLASYRGRAVLVTFLYTHCPDVCPLMTSNLRVALGMLGARASRVQVIAVSVDPRGDTPAAVARFLRAHEMLGRMRYLIGSAPELARTWSAWKVGSLREAGQPQRIAHSALVYGVGADGTLRTIYPSSFEPAQIVHDVPRLAAR
jgi:protein SCO1